MGDFGVRTREQMQTTMCIFKPKADGNRKEQPMKKIEITPEMEEELNAMGAGDPEKEELESEIYEKN